MNKEKINNIRLTASIHTLEIECKPDPDHRISYSDSAAISSISYKSDGTAVLTINPNRIQIDHNWDQFVKTFRRVLGDLKIPEKGYQINRVDMRLDTTETGFYESYAKVFNYLLALFAVKNKLYNDYRVTGIFSGRQKDSAVKSRHGDIELEYYDRGVKSTQTNNTQDKAQARFEIRSKRRRFTSLRQKFSRELDMIKQEFMHTWIHRFGYVIAVRDEVETRLNNELLSEWRATKQDTAVSYRGYVDFILANQQRIVTKQQLINLLRVILREEDNTIDPVKKASNMKTLYSMEFVSRADLEQIIKRIQQSILKFFA